MTAMYNAAVQDRDRALNELEAAGTKIVEERERLAAIQRELEELREQQAAHHARRQSLGGEEDAGDGPGSPGRAQWNLSGPLAAQLAGLELSDDVREKLQQALLDLEAAGQGGDEGAGDDARAGRGGAAAGVQEKQPASRRRTKPKYTELLHENEALMRKCAMSKGIMKKLYRKNVELQKEAQAARADAAMARSAPVDFEAAAASAAAAAAAAKDGGRSAPGTPMAGENLFGEPDSLATRALTEKDRIISQLKYALDASRRRAAMLELAVAEQHAHTTTYGPSGGGGGTNASGKQAAPTKQREMLRQMQFQVKQYTNMKSQYYRLLRKRADAVEQSDKVVGAVKALVRDLLHRLEAEIEEREAESALYNAKLYELERLQADWYVERRVLEERLAEREEELAGRDRLDGRMNTLVAGMHAKMAAMERQLSTQTRDESGSAGEAGGEAGSAGGAGGEGAGQAEGEGGGGEEGAS
ncbi:unnamed protein product [Pedinophyceae sp. YPF-701]|nr:unnamed protein product [Pedinophyceae sp. YPF-701]